MRIKPETEIQVTLLDPNGPLAWLGNDKLVGWLGGDSGLLKIVQFIGNTEYVCPWPEGTSPELIFNGDGMAPEIVSPDGKKVVVRLCVDGPVPTHLFLYDTDE